MLGDWSFSVLIDLFSSRYFDRKSTDGASNINDCSILATTVMQDNNYVMLSVTFVFVQLTVSAVIKAYCKCNE